MKALITLLLVLVIVSGFAFANPTPSFASDNNNNANNNNYTHFFENWRSFFQLFDNWRNFFLNNHDNNNSDQNFCKQHPEDNKCKNNDNKDDKDCSKHPERSECYVSVPEFGFIPGVIATLTSGGAFYYLKKKVYN